jgi:hypothetical protein
MDTVTILADLRSRLPNMLGIGDRLNHCRATLRSSEFSYLKTVVTSQVQMSASKAGLWMVRAKKLKEHFPNPAVYNQLLLYPSGRDIIVRFKEAGKKGYYDLSPHVVEAMSHLGPAPDGGDAEKAKEYVWQLLDLSRKLRGKARTPGPNF